MGDYDWHIATDTNAWSDQLYRIYGHEPQSFNASYERFLAHIHPEDRERITAIHQRAYASGEPYEMIERIVRPSGEVRYLASNGQVIKDEDRQPRPDARNLYRHHRHRARRARARATRCPVPRAGRVGARCDSRARRRTARSCRPTAAPANCSVVRLPGTTSRQLLPWPDPDGEAVAAVSLDGRSLQLDVTYCAAERGGRRGL